MSVLCDFIRTFLLYLNIYFIFQIPCTNLSYLTIDSTLSDSTLSKYMSLCTLSSPPEALLFKSPLFFLALPFSVTYFERHLTDF